jgi:hypothetical protein
LLIDTIGAEAPVTVTLAAALVVELPALSVATAVRENTPALAGFQLKL